MIEMKETDMNTTTDNPIAVAVAPLKEDAMNAAEAYALRVVDKVREELAAARNDLNIAAPYPNSSRVSRVEYHVMHAKRSLFLSLTKEPVPSYRPHGPKIVEMNEVRIPRFIQEAREEAAASYDAFVAKLIAKIGAVETATLSGRGVWSHSIVAVVKTDGSKENWKTQQILNVSSLGKVFNQWPTRKVK